MKRVNWDGTPLVSSSVHLPSDLSDTIFDYLPKPIRLTPEIQELAIRYTAGEVGFKDYRAKQAAKFIQPLSEENHNQRRDRFCQLSEEAISAGYSIPKNFRTLVETDAFIDRIHHNTIWMQMPEELWRLPEDPTQLVFLAFVEGQGCCNWHLLLNLDGSHKMVCCDSPFGWLSIWPIAKNGSRSVPDYSDWIVDCCADTIEEWLYHFFVESAEYNRRYISYLKPYHDDEYVG